MNGTSAVCFQEASPSKKLKLEDPLDGDPLSRTSQKSESDNSQHLGDNLSQETVSRDEYGESTQKSSHPSLPLPQQKGESNSQKIQNVWILKLERNQVFARLLDAFSQEKLPDKIIYDGQGYRLTAMYNEFWETFYESPNYSEGHREKIPKIQNKIKPMAKILKRGWEDERYWPKKLSHPFLETCLFGEPSTNSMKSDVFLDFIEPSDALLIRNANIVDQNVIGVFNKYHVANIISTEENIENNCANAVIEIMVVNMKPVTDVWQKELKDLMPRSSFDFLMNPTLKPYFNMMWKDMESYSAPHELWQTFFLGWPEDKVKYYFRALANVSFDSDRMMCNQCGCPDFDAKHFLCVCKVLLETLRSERHDAVLHKLLDQVNLAIRREGSYFSQGNDWKVLKSFKNAPLPWPMEMSSVHRDGEAKIFPHVIVYSLSPKKRALVIEYSISWEHWIDLEKEKMSLKYQIIKERLEEAGFEVEYRVFVLGSRGVFIDNLYDLFEQIFAMKHSEISKCHEEISQEILNIPYQSKFYKELMEAKLQRS